MTKISDFMKAAGTLPEAPVASNYVTDQYMKLVDSDPEAQGIREPRELSRAPRAGDGLTARVKRVLRGRSACDRRRDGRVPLRRLVRR